METTLFSMINLETPETSSIPSVEPTMELVMLDDAQMRQVGGGLVLVVNF